MLHYKDHNPTTPFEAFEDSTTKKIPTTQVTPQNQSETLISSSSLLSKLKMGIFTLLAHVLSQSDSRLQVDVEIVAAAAVTIALVKVPALAAE